MNDLFLVGRLTADVEVRQSTTGKKVTDIVLAVDRPFKNSDGEVDTDFITVVCWDYLAENMAKICSKGTLIVLRGRVQMRYVQVGEQKIQVPEIIGEKFLLCSTPKKSEE